MTDVDFGPVRFRFESSQRKNHVVLYDSELYRGKTSEWFLTSKNSSKRNETYRCVHCRCLAEKNRRSKTEVDMTSKKAGARIVIKEGRFMTDPDFPLGGHICNFENNSNCDTAVVWGRRALLRANTELREKPEKPKLKFEQLIQSIRDGTEYAHLDHETRQRVIEVITNSRNGFDSRRRSFARNNSIAIKKVTGSTSMDEETKRDLTRFKLRQRKTPTDDSNGRNCPRQRRIHNIREPTTNYQDPTLLDPSRRRQAENKATIMAHDDAVTFDIERLAGTTDPPEDPRVEIYGHAIAPSPDHFMGSVNNMLDQIYEYSTLVSHNPQCRDIIFAQLSQSLQLCAILCQQEGYVLEQPENSQTYHDQELLPDPSFA